MHCCTQCPDTEAGPCRPTPLPETPGHSRASLGQSLVGSLLLSPGYWCTHTVLFVSSKNLFPQLCVSSKLYGGINGNLLQKGLCHTQVCYIQSPCHCGRPLLMHTSAGDTQKQCWLSLCGLSGSCCTQGLFDPSEHLWQLWGLILNVISSLLPSCRGFSFALGCRVSFFLVGSNILLTMALQQRIVTLEFSQEKMSAHPSTPPSYRWVTIVSTTVARIP